MVLDLPNLDLALPDPVLAAHIRAAEAEACYENLCLLYVAMTRAKRAMYVITKAVGRSESANFPRLLRETLGESWAAGDPRWFQAVAFADPSAGEARGDLPVLRDAPHRGVGGGRPAGRPRPAPG